MSNPSRG